LTLLLIPILRRLLLLAVFLAIPFVAAELLARKLIGDAVTHAVAARIGVSPKVGFGSTPLLLQLAHGSLDAVSVSASGARIDGLPPVELTGTLRDVHLRSLTALEGAIGSLSVDVRLPASGVRDLLATPSCVGSLPANVLAALTRTPRVAVFPGRIDLLPPRGRATEVRLAPVAVGASVRFALIGLELAGAPSSAVELAAVRAETRCSRTLTDLPFGVSLRSAQARWGALELTFAGSGASFSAVG
jgi:hypothetical protein